uniref:MLLT3 super elongation complex subunit n=1 Tax=Oncorhynchus kisutch TaxID=8019 RepID=A0A8C7HJ88_ONCKI
MATSGAVQVKLELGHRAQVRKKPTVEGFTHDWMVFVRGPEHSNIQHFVEKVVFHLHESFPRPKREANSAHLLQAMNDWATQMNVSILQTITCLKFLNFLYSLSMEGNLGLNAPLL